MKKAIYICIEGVEGVGKSTQTQLLVDTLRARGFSVLQTKEPGTSLIPLTMVLRGVMLDNQYDEILTPTAREFISQAIRSIHMERLILPSLYEYDYIVQDRGVMSGVAYGVACGNNANFLWSLSDQVMPVDTRTTFQVEYDFVVRLKGDPLKGLAKAKASKQEYEAGDAMESRGDSFIKTVSSNMDYLSNQFNTVTISVDDKTPEEVHKEIIVNLGLGK